MSVESTEQTAATETTATTDSQEQQEPTVNPGETVSLARLEKREPPGNGVKQEPLVQPDPLDPPEQLEIPGLAALLDTP